MPSKDMAVPHGTSGSSENFGETVSEVTIMSIEDTKKMIQVPCVEGTRTVLPCKV